MTLTEFLKNRDALNDARKEYFLRKGLRLWEYLKEHGCTKQEAYRELKLQDDINDCPMCQYTADNDDVEDCVICPVKWEGGYCEYDPDFKTWACRVRMHDRDGAMIAADRVYLKIRKALNKLLIEMRAKEERRAINVNNQPDDSNEIK